MRKIDREAKIAYSVPAVEGAVLNASEDTARMKMSIRVTESPSVTLDPGPGLGAYVPSDAATATSDAAALKYGQGPHLTAGAPYTRYQDGPPRGLGFMKKGHDAGVAALRSQAGRIASQAVRGA
jgi:hypothetical protein